MFYMIKHIALEVIAEFRGAPSRNSFTGSLKIDHRGRLIITPATVNNIIRFYLEANGGNLWRPPSEVWVRKGGSRDSWEQKLPPERKDEDDVFFTYGDFILGGVIEFKKGKEKEKEKKKKDVPDPFSFYPILTTSYLISLHPVDVKVISKSSAFASTDKNNKTKEGRNLPSNEYVPYAVMGGLFTVTYTDKEEDAVRSIFSSSDWKGITISRDETIESFLSRLVKISLLSYRTGTYWFEYVDVEIVENPFESELLDYMQTSLFSAPSLWQEGVKIRSVDEWKKFMETMK